MVVREMAHELGEMMTTEQAGEYLKLPADEVERLVAEGSLPAARIGEDHWRIPEAVLNEWLRSSAYGNLAATRRLDGRRALARLDAVRERIAERRGGELLPEGYGAELVREGRS
jgi:excisionase family DNA binding protein